MNNDNEKEHQPKWKPWLVVILVVLLLYGLSHRSAPARSSSTVRSTTTPRRVYYSYEQPKDEKLCKYKDCKNYKKDGFDYCNSHKCIYSDCNKPRIEGSKCCSYHDAQYEEDHARFIAEQKALIEKANRNSKSSSKTSRDPDDYDIDGYYEDYDDEYDDWDDAWDDFDDWDDY